MSENEVTRVMLRAHEQGMTNGEYVWIRYYYIPDKPFYWVPWTYAAPENITDEEMEKRKEAFYTYKQVCLVITDIGFALKISHLIYFSAICLDGERDVPPEHHLARIEINKSILHCT